VGTREVTSEGIKGDLYISGEFARRGFNIVSGLAIGCDTYAHKGALNVGGKTTAFLANSLEYSLIYPSENKGLAEEIVDKGGLLLSEYSIGKNANKYNLVARDRLQSALSLATIVIQTGIKGGTMHAANTTLKSGKPLYAMKYKDEFTNQHEKSLGNAYLVKQGAKYISGGDNIDELCQSILNSKPV
jgi:DNA processing protein